MMILFFALLFAGTESFASTYAQSAKISLQLKKQSIEKVFEAIKKQSEFKFFYNDTQLDVNRKVSVDVENESINEVLNHVLEGTNCTYEVYEKQIIIKEIPKVEKQQGKVKVNGKVIDSSGMGLPGVSVVIKGTTTGVSTDISGHFSFDVENRNEIVLVVSFVGMKTKTVSVVGAMNDLTIVLEDDIENLGEVVVTGYQTISKERATGAYNVINADAVEKQSADNLADRLEGTVPGLLITNRDNGEDFKIRIRGQSSIGANSDPLIVVDGFPIEGGLSTVNPDDIQSINVLQDAAAASIWGARAGNGVIVINTKKGKKGKMSVRFGYNLTINPNVNLSALELANSASAVDYLKERVDLGLVNLDDKSAGGKNVLNSVWKSMYQLQNGEISEAQNNANLQHLREVDLVDQYEEHLMQTRVNQQYSMSVQGGSENSVYYFSSKYTKNRSAFIGDESDKLNFEYKQSIDLLKNLRLNLGASLIFKNEENNSPGVNPLIGQSSEFASLLPFQEIFDSEGNIVYQERGYSDEYKQQFVDAGYYDWNYNIYEEMKRMDKTEKRRNSRYNVGLQYDLNSDLSFSSKFMYESGRWKEENLYDESTYYTRNFVNIYTLNNNGNLEYQVPRGDILYWSENEFYSYTFNALTEYSKTLKEKHRISALAGIEMREYVIERNMSNVYYGYSDRKQTYNTNIDWEALSNGIGTFDDPNAKNKEARNRASLYYNKERYFSVFSNLAYTYNDIHTLTASVRMDQTNLLVDDKSFTKQPLYSFGYSLNLINSGLLDFGKFNQLKFRSTFGSSGNIDRSTSSQLIMTNYSFNNWLTGFQYGAITNPANQELKWERVQIANVGIDFDYNSKLWGSFDFYDKRSKDLIAQFSLNPTYGFTSMKKNGGDMYNRGFDLVLNYKVLDTKDWKLVLSGNVSYNKNKVTTVEESSADLDTYLVYTWEPKLNKPLHAVYSYKWAGLSSTGQPQVYNENGEVVDWNPGISSKDALEYSGTLDPKYYGGFSTNLTYKNFYLNTLFSFKGGNVFRKPTASYREANSGTVHKDFEKRWRVAGDENMTNVPGTPVESGTALNKRDKYFALSSANIREGDYIRFKELTLGYKFKNTNHNLPFKTCDLKFQVMNLGLLWTANDEGLDPEYLPQRGSNVSYNNDPNLGLYPGLAPTTSYTIGINVTF